MCPPLLHLRILDLQQGHLDVGDVVLRNPLEAAVHSHKQTDLIAGPGLHDKIFEPVRYEGELISAAVIDTVGDVADNPGAFSTLRQEKRLCWLIY